MALIVLVGKCIFHVLYYFFFFQSVGKLSSSGVRRNYSPRPWRKAARGSEVRRGIDFSAKARRHEGKYQCPITFIFRLFIFTAIFPGIGQLQGSRKLECVST